MIQGQIGQPVSSSQGTSKPNIATRIAPVVKPNCRNPDRSSSGIVCCIATSVQFELILPGRVLLPCRLLILVEQEVFHDKVIHFSPHEAPISISRCTDDRFAANIERCVYKYSTSSALIERLEQVVIPGIRFVVNCLYSRRVVDMCNSREL